MDSCLARAFHRIAPRTRNARICYPTPPTPSSKKNPNFFQTINFSPNFQKNPPLSTHDHRIPPRLAQQKRNPLPSPPSPSHPPSPTEAAANTAAKTNRNKPPPRAPNAAVKTPQPASTMNTRPRMIMQSRMIMKSKRRKIRNRKSSREMS